MGRKLGYKLAEGVTDKCYPSLPSVSEVSSLKLAVTPLAELADHLIGDIFIPYFNQINKKFQLKQ